MIDITIFRDCIVVGAAIAMLGYAAAAQVMMTFLPLYLQDAFGHSPAQAGLAMLPFALPLLIGPGVGGKLSGRMSSRAILSFGLCLVAVGDAVAASAAFVGLGYWTAAVGMLLTGCGAGLLNSETAKAQIGSVPADRAGMASGLAGTTRFIGIISGVAGLGAVLSAVTESSVRRLGTPLVPGQSVDWRALSLRVVGGDAPGALSTLTETTKAAISGAVEQSVALGFGASLSAAAFVALLAAWASWRLLAPSGKHRRG
jgi:MFS family permease